MSQILPDAPAPRLSQQPGRPRRASFDSLDQLVAILPARPAAAHWQSLPGGAALRAAARRAGDKVLVGGRLQNKRGTGISVGRLPDQPMDRFAQQKFAGDVIDAALRERPASIGILLPGHGAGPARELAESLVLAAHARSFIMPHWRDHKPHRDLRRIRLLGLDHRLDLARVEIAARAQNLARWLTALPPNRLNAAAYRKLVAAMAKEHGWSMRFLDEKRLRQLGAGAFLAVAQGNASRDAGIIHLHYRPAGQKAPQNEMRVALVGKGILFDTGGNNLKPHKSMLDMHEDMAGSAVALATLRALTELGWEHPVDCWLAVTENRAGATAYRPRDVLTAANGISIEVIHTDAEGRLVLADALALAAREKPSLVIDYATLTGACVNALTERYSGVFSNRERLADMACEAGKACGERVWPFPMDSDYDDDLESKSADILQCAVEGSGDHILAARFLSRFLPAGMPWLHLDLSAASRKQGLGHLPGGATGFGVRLSLECLLAGADRLRQLLAASSP